MRSNCLIEALKARKSNPNVTIFRVPRVMSRIRHYMWFDGKDYVHFSLTGTYKWYKALWFKGHFKKISEVVFNRFALQYLCFVNVEERIKIGKKLRLKVVNIFSKDWQRCTDYATKGDEDLADLDGYANLPTKEDIDFLSKVTGTTVLIKVAKDKSLELLTFDEVLKLKQNKESFHFKVLGPLDDDFFEYKNYRYRSNRMSWDEIN